MMLGNVLLCSILSSSSKQFPIYIHCFNHPWVSVNILTLFNQRYTSLPILDSHRAGLSSDANGPMEGPCEHAEIQASAWSRLAEPGRSGIPLGPITRRNGNILLVARYGETSCLICGISDVTIDFCRSCECEQLLESQPPG